MPLPKENHDKIRQAVKLFLEGIGCDPTEGQLRHTPGRVVRMLDRIMDGAYAEIGALTTFEHNHYKGIVICHHVPFYSFCAHHLLPFMGTFAIGYIPGEGEILGLSKLIRIFRHGCKVPTTQEDITQDAIDKVMETLPKCNGAICHVSAEHTCMSLRGVQAHGARTTTLAYSKDFTLNLDLRNQFLLEATK